MYVVSWYADDPATLKVHMKSVQDDYIQALRINLKMYMKFNQDSKDDHKNAFLFKGVIYSLDKLKDLNTLYVS